MTPATRLTWSVVIPVKVLARAKSRLRELDDRDRQDLALAMACDTVEVAARCAAAGAVVVVSDDQAVREQADALGVEVVRDLPRSGLNDALGFGAAYAASRWPGNGLAALTADLPALSDHELEEALAAAGRVGQAFVVDAAGTGTTMYAARPGTRFRPLFGIMSAERHRQAGVVELDLPESAGLRQDVDTLADLRAASAIGLGRRSSAWTKTRGW